MRNWRGSVVSPGEAEPEEVAAERRRVPVTGGRADNSRRIHERPAPKQTGNFRIQRFRGIDLICPSVVTHRLEPVAGVFTPFIGVTEHVEQSQVVRQQAAAWPSMVAAVGIEAGVSPQKVERETVVACRRRPRAAGELPFGLRRQSVARSLERVCRDCHALVILTPFVGVVAPLILGQAFPLAQPVAVGHGAKPGHAEYGAGGVGTLYVDMRSIGNELRVLPHEALILLDGHLLGCDGEPARDEPWVRRFIGAPIGLGRWRADEKFDGPFDQGKRLPLAVDEPAAVAPILEAGQFGIGGRELGLLVPPPQRPLGRAVNA